MKETGIWPLYYDSFSLGVSPDRLVVNEEESVVATYEAKCPLSGKLMNPPSSGIPVAGPCADTGGGSRRRELSSPVDAGEEFLLPREPGRCPVGDRGPGSREVCH